MPPEPRPAAAGAAVERHACARPSLRAWLAGLGPALLQIDEPLPVRHHLTALQHALEKAGRHPVISVRHPLLPDGRDSPIPVLTNLTASRSLVAGALGLADHRIAGEALARAAKGGCPPVVVDRASAPIAEVVETGSAIDLSGLPATVQHALDPGPYLTAAHATTRDPETGIDNTAIQRCWIRSPTRMTWYPYPSSHNARNLRRHWDRGQPCPVAFWIGHHPAVVIGAQAKLAYPQSHWEAAGAAAGAPLRLTPTFSFGEALLVPADAEIVIEGLAHPHDLGADGPFGEYTGYMGPQIIAPMVEVLAITRRHDALFHDYGSGLADMLVPENMAMEGKLFALAAAVAPSLQAVHVPVSGRRFHAWLALSDPGPGEARDALAAVLAWRRLKLAAAFDADVDVFDEAQVLWAIATRVQWHRDIFRLDGLSTSTLDPSLAAGARTTSKVGIDATLPLADGAGVRPVPPAAVSPPEARAAADDLLRRLRAAGRLEGAPCL